MITEERIEEIRKAHKEKWLYHHDECDLFEYIKQQKEEIESLKSLLEDVTAAAKARFDEIERLEAENEKLIDESIGLDTEIEQLNLNIRDAFYQKEMAENKAERLEKENVELIDEWRDRLSTLYKATSAPLPAQSHAQALAEGILAIANEMTMHLTIKGLENDR